MSKTTDILIGVSLAAIGALIAWLVLENSRQHKLIKGLELDKLKLIQDAIRQNDSISEEIKKQLHTLIQKYQSIDPSIAEEINTALVIIEAGEAEKGIGSLSLIIENLLKEKYKASSKFRSWLRQNKDKNIKGAIKLDYLEYAKVDQIINKEEFEFAKAVKSIRDGTFHEPGKKLPENFTKAGILVGIELILKIGTFKSQLSIA